MNYIHSKSAFSLIELSVLLVIFGVVISGVLSISTASIINSKHRQTNDNFKQIYQALGTFLLTNKRLPCPASLTKNKISDNDYGNEVANCQGQGVFQSNTNSNLVYGGVPIKALGLTNDFMEDGFGSKISYVIDKRFTQTNTPEINFANPSFATAPSSNNLIIKNKTLTMENIISSDSIVILISHGANKSGAFAGENTEQLPRLSDNYENENSLTNLSISSSSTADYDNVFFNAVFGSLTFDDLVFFKSKKNFVDDFKAHHLTACYDAGTLFGNRNAYFEEIIFANHGCWGNEQNKRLSRKCLDNGAWLEYSPCTFCRIATVAGVNSIDVAIGSGSLNCDLSGYSSTVSYQCFVDGSFSISGQCTQNN